MRRTTARHPVARRRWRGTGGISVRAYVPLMDREPVRLPPDFDGHDELLSWWLPAGAVCAALAT
jgi:hypothetical protein